MENQEYIWRWLRAHTDLPDESIAGIIGNLQAESGCEPGRKQGDFSSDRSSSKVYCAGVNDGSISADRFAHDAIGFGLAQWTYYSRKEKLLSFCKAKGKPIEDMDSQLTFLVKEMQQDYSGLWNNLLSCSNVKTATDLVLRIYERPAVLNLDARFEAAKGFYNSYNGMTFEDASVYELPDYDSQALPAEENAPLIDDAIEQLQTAIALLQDAILALKGGAQ